MSYNDYNPVLEHLGSKIGDYPPGVQCLLTQMGEQMERVRRMILDYNAWAKSEPERPDCISLLRGMQMQPGPTNDPSPADRLAERMRIR